MIPVFCSCRIFGEYVLLQIKYFVPSLTFVKGLNWRIFISWVVPSLFLRLFAVLGFSLLSVFLLVCSSWMVEGNVIFCNCISVLCSRIKDHLWCERFINRIVFYLCFRPYCFMYLLFKYRKVFLIKRVPTTLLGSYDQSKTKIKTSVFWFNFVLSGAFPYYTFKYNPHNIFNWLTLLT